MRTVMYVKTDKEVKENAQKLASELGLTLSDVINASLRNFLRVRQITFSSIPHLTPELEKILGRVEEDIKNKRNLSKRFTRVEDAIKYLDKV